MSLRLPEASETHVWQLYLPDVCSYLNQSFEWLSADERDRAQRFIRAEDRDRFTLARGGLRYLLAEYLACSPESLCFAYSDYGKPSLTKSYAPLHFNLAHSGQWVVYAVGSQELLGVDVEQINLRTHLDGLIERCLTVNEQANLAKASREPLRSFFKHWTVKEAHLKAIGLGLSYPMTEVEIDWTPYPKLARPAVVEGHKLADWTVRLWSPAEDAIAAVCVGRSDCAIQIRPFPSPTNDA